MTVSADVNGDLMSAYLHHWKTLRQALKRRTGSLELAEDALQETWLRLSSMKAAPTPIQDKQAFVLRVAANIAVDLARREIRHTSRCISDDDIMRAVADSQPSPETCVIDRDQLRCLAVALGQLPVKPRLALLLSRCEKMPYAVIAKKLGVSQSMVAKYLTQALRHCRDHFRALS
tara:strand:+ start:8673 stop:9197 length:525 start_codon:yes stop_codon:yes gene_type:complete